ncbi:acyl-CoA thioesterase [Rhizosphaericola mali]|uniref:Acyl-CoA thioesterase n=1 Tax=Rhizosphaericola mali TaxID=2545455 RepID=A0A5P2G5L1_9BACT|nr:acyl-CoA thioesterase [Rhizosphaericola mali]QES89968.1 acyl-CoA thioesterase [Rhizosphaericola mali]
MKKENTNELVFRFLSEPSDVNFGGKVHGGAVMKWIDQAGYACAANWSESYCVTVYVGGIQFYKPIAIGDLIEIKSKIIYTGKTSMHVGIDVYAGKPQSKEYVQTTHCVIVFVAVNENGAPIPVKKWTPETISDKSLEAYALRLMDLRKSIDDEMKKQGKI